MTEHLSGMAVAFVPTLPRPWVDTPLDGSLRRDDEIGVCFKYELGSGMWVPFGSNDKQGVIVVNVVLGNDANAGDVFAPVQSIAEAIRRIPPHVTHDITIDIEDNGVILTYDEVLHLRNKMLDADIIFQGKDRFAVITGSNPVPPHAANTGDNFQITINDPAHVAWIPRALIGKKALFTAGPHAGVTAYILDNTANQLWLGYYPFPVIEGPYGPADGFDILENTVLIDNLSVANEHTFTLSQILGEENVVVTHRVRFNEINFLGAGVGFSSVRFRGVVNAEFNDCVLEDVVGGGNQAGSGYIEIMESLLNAAATGSRNILAVSTPGWNGSIGIISTGILGGTMRFNGWGDVQVQMSFSNVIADSVHVPGEMALFSGGILDIVACGFDARNLCTPILLEGPYRSGRGRGGLLNLNTVEILNSITSGINTQPLDLCSFNIALDRSPVFVVSNIGGHGGYSMDISSPCLVNLYDTTTSIPPNTTGGMMLRHKALAKFSGQMGSEPLMTGPAGQEIDFDERNPPLWIPWTSQTYFGGDTLCGYIYNGQP